MRLPRTRTDARGTRIALQLCLPRERTAGAVETIKEYCRTNDSLNVPVRELDTGQRLEKQAIFTRAAGEGAGLAVDGLGGGTV